MNRYGKYRNLDAFVEARIAPRVVEIAKKSYDCIELIRRMFPKTFKGLKVSTFQDWVRRARELGHDIPPLQTLFKKREKPLRPQLDNIRFPFIRHEEMKKAKRFIITSALNDVAVDPGFWQTVKQYAERNDAMIIVVPTRYLNPTRKTNETDGYQWPAQVCGYLTDDLVELHEHLHLRADLRIPATAARPLSSIGDLTKGVSAIFGHAQLAMKTVAVPQNSQPKVLWTTCSASVRDYSDSKTGMVGRFHHTIGALIVELDGSRFYTRSVLWDGEAFHDLNWRYSPNGRRPAEADAIVVGDEHADFADQKCVAATYFGPKSICGVTRPKQIVRHDVVDSYAISHHHEKNAVTKIAKARKDNNRDLILDELQRCADYINNTTPDGASNTVVSANHPDHVLQWMNRSSPLSDPRNADAFVELWATLIPTIQYTPSRGAVCGDPVALWMAPKLKSPTRFLSRDESNVICGVETGYHGDKGINGARGSASQYAKLGARTVIGHSHSPCIDHGCYQTGTMTGQLEYQSGPSTWAQAHVLIYPNGKRQHIFVINGHWRLQEGKGK